MITRIYDDVSMQFIIVYTPLMTAPRRTLKLSSLSRFPSPRLVSSFQRYPSLTHGLKVRRLLPQSGTTVYGNVGITPQVFETTNCLDFSTRKYQDANATGEILCMERGVKVSLAGEGESKRYRMAFQVRSLALLVVDCYHQWRFSRYERDKRDDRSIDRCTWLKRRAYTPIVHSCTTTRRYLANSFTSTISLAPRPSPHAPPRHDAKPNRDYRP